MDKEDFADSHASTLTTSEQVKGILGDDSSIYLDKRKIDSNIEFDELMASVSDSSKCFTFIHFLLTQSNIR